MFPPRWEHSVTLPSPPRASSGRRSTGETPGTAEARPLLREGTAALGETVRWPSREGGRDAAAAGWEPSAWAAGAGTGWMGWKAPATSMSSTVRGAGEGATDPWRGGARGGRGC